MRLNELARFAKRSQRLALEAHSHCEVPAGCGGAVLRWRRPGAPLGIWISTYLTPGCTDLRLDGMPLDETRVKVAPGEHVLSFVVDQPRAKTGFVLARVELRPTIQTAHTPVGNSGEHGRWHAARSEPQEGWRAPGFDVTGFETLIEAPVPEPDDHKRWMVQSMGATAGRGLSGDATRAWVRWSFSVDDGGFR